MPWIYLDNDRPRGGCGPALLSLMVPGMGQLIQGRIGTAAAHFIVACACWLLLMGWAVHLYSAHDASQ